MAQENMLESLIIRVQFSSVQSLSCVQLFVTPWPVARQASLSITNSQSLLKLMSNQSILKESSPECSLEGLMLKLWPSDANN